MLVVSWCRDLAPTAPSHAGAADNVYHRGIWGFIGVYGDIIGIYWDIVGVYRDNGRENGP